MNRHILKPEDLRDQGFHTVIVGSPDLQGRLLGRRIPVEGFERVLKEGVEVCTCAWAWDTTQSLSLVESGAFELCNYANGIPDVRLRPDLSTLRRAAWLEGVAICLADPVDIKTEEPMTISPRVLLKKEIEAYRQSGLVPKAGTELEFYLFRNDPRELREQGFRNLRPTTLVASDFMIHEGNAYEWFFRKLRDDLKNSGIEMEAAQSEYGLGQWEMTFVYGDPLEMADRHLLYKLAVRDSAVAAGLSVSFMAKPVNSQPGSSCHVHFSILDESGNTVFWDDSADHNMSETMRYATAGVLQHIPEFMVWYAPTVNAYRRVNSTMVAGSGRTWGHENRTVSVRRVGSTPSSMRFEFRLPGADTNPYLTLAGLLASARDGITNKSTLCPPTTGNAYALPPDTGMPTHLGEAAELFCESEFVQEIIGKENARHFKELAGDEWRQFQSSVTDWELDRYFDRI
ncbi:glutamine synthetase family protein [Paraburkholderia acidicola]|uniref:Glutamine synthetase family protein n=1 Tax=Paraburkholderia acidicola TaxID=1912599 RepID=A0ABV1LVD7_9BURK